MIVLDASALLAYLYAEPGHESVPPLLQESHVSAVNWSETLQQIAFHGGDPDRQGALLIVLGVTVQPLTEEDAARAAKLYPATRAAGLSLADRCCLALAGRLGVPALTADRAWSGLDAGAEIRVLH
ncbi:type II toxin-antitoxin system VapC family toxin [Jiangella anatolica]|uniref:PIN domain nuclease n=1 Tax=Jiangella anatolica TaxID=2670374 RepID=A0A2W2C7R9_9ACTN|nr:type II toxin-antitoxin system VapC family toxin [Jiangella anatolica]PZF81776.1 PIN domain nuclease [Jiangella anatolica]